MKKRLVLKPFVIPTIYSIFVVALIVGLFVSINMGSEQNDENTYVSGTILDEYVPVVNTTEQEEVIDSGILHISIFMIDD